MKRKNIVIIGVIMVLVSITAFIIYLDIPGWTKLDLTKIYEIELSTKIYDGEGNEAAVLSGNINRTYVDLDMLPAHVKNAFIAAEDTRFYQHNGIDVRRIFGAMLSNLKSGSYSQGASTITQQLIKLTHLSGEKTMSRKAQEAWLALQLERQLSKDEILEAYLNIVYFGGGAYGISAASQRYFAKEADELTISEAAMLAGIIKSPTSYAPHNDMQAALKRRDYVLRAMAVEGYIDEYTLQSAMAEEIILNERRSDEMEYMWYADAAAAEACKLLGVTYEELLGSGYRIYTALDTDMQLAAENIMRSDNFYPEQAAQGAMVVMNNADGAITALVGGRQYTTRLGMNRALSAYRQPGSLIKPISTYAAAVEKYGYLPTSRLYDIQRTYADGYFPGNAGGLYYGETTLRQALSRSLNAATADLADTVGIKSAAEMAEGFGLEIHDEDINLALSLGALSYGATPVQMCAAYAALADGGIYHDAHLVTRIEDKHGNLLYKHEDEGRVVISEESAYIITDMLKTAASEGTAASLSSLGIPVAAKTGTSGLENGDTADAWAAVYTPEMSVTVWIGKDTNSDGGMAKSVSGSGYAVPACKAFLESVSDRLSGRDFNMPAGLLRVLIDKYALENGSGIMLAASGTPRQYVTEELFRSTDGLSVSDIWEAPLAIQDLRLISEPGDTPLIQFTGTSSYAEYVIIRRAADSTEAVGIVECEAGETVRFMDTEAETGQVNVYSVIPRHALLHDLGTTLAGAESGRVSSMPPGLLNGIAELLDTEDYDADIEAIMDPLF